MVSDPLNKQVTLQYVFPTGYVPVHRFKFGNTYKNGTELAVTDFKRRDQTRKAEIQDLNMKASTSPQLKVLSTHPPPDASHPGTNLRYATAYYGKQFCKITFNYFPCLMFYYAIYIELDI